MKPGDTVVLTIEIEMDGEWRQRTAAYRVMQVDHPRGSAGDVHGLVLREKRSTPTTMALLPK